MSTVTDVSQQWVEIPFEAQKAHDGMRVDAFLTARLHRYSRAEVQRLVDEGRVALIRKWQGKPMIARASNRVAAGDRLILRYPRREDPPANHSSLPVIFEDADILAINKPGDVLSHPTDKVVANSVTSILKTQFPGTKLFMAHRLDRETSGILLLGKNQAAARSLVSQFMRRKTSKQYLAIAAGRVLFKHKIVDSAIGREEKEIKVRQKILAAGELSPTAQTAVTEFFALEGNDRATLVRALPKTGRLHQIRVHLASIGHPVIGDKLYTGDGEVYLKAVRRTVSAEDLQRLGAERQMLHAWKIAFTHPAERRPVELTAPPPPDFVECLNRLEVRSGVRHQSELYCHS